MNSKRTGFFIPLYGVGQQDRGRAWTTKTAGDFDMTRQKMEDMYEQLAKIKNQAEKLERAYQKLKHNFAIAVAITCFLFLSIIICQ